MKGVCIDRVGFQYLCETYGRLFIPSEGFQNRSFQIYGRIIPAVIVNGFIQAVESHFPVLFFRIHLSELGICPGIVSIIPCSPVKSIVSSISLALDFENQTEIVKSFGILWSCIIFRLPPDSGTEITGSLVIFSPHTIVCSHDCIRPGIARVTSENFFEIVNGINERIMELQIPQSHKETFFRILYLFRKKWRFHDFRQRGRIVLLHRGI